MNWVDIALIGTLAAGGLLGIWIGMVRASFGVLGVVAGFVVVGHYRDDAAAWLAGFVANEAIVIARSPVVRHQCFFVDPFEINRLALAFRQPRNMHTESDHDMRCIQACAHGYFPLKLLLLSHALDGDTLQVAVA